MNTRCFATLILILTLSLVSLLNYSAASMYPEGTWDHSTIATTSTLEATHIVVGEVIHVSFVNDDLISIVIVRVDKDIKAEIERVDSRDTNPVGNVSEGNSDATLPAPGEDIGKSTLEDDASPQTVSFIQAGGPWADGGWVEASGLPLLRSGDYVFLRLKPNNGPQIIHSGKECNSVIDAYGTVYTVQKHGDDIDDYIIEKGWQKLDFNVLDMIRIVRATLEQPETMRTLELEVHGVRRAGLQGVVEQENHSQNVVNKVLDIEKELSLPSLDDDAQ